jgi:hypothetical protein
VLPLLGGGGGGGAAVLLLGAVVFPPDGFFGLLGLRASDFSAGSAPELVRVAEIAAEGSVMAFAASPAFAPPEEAVALPMPNATTNAATTAPIVMAS